MCNVMQFFTPSSFSKLQQLSQQDEMCLINANQRNKLKNKKNHIYM